jgi:hypothetical protein
MRWRQPTLDGDSAIGSGDRHGGDGRGNAQHLCRPSKAESKKLMLSAMEPDRSWASCITAATCSRSAEGGSNVVVTRTDGMFSATAATYTYVRGSSAAMDSRPDSPKLEREA